MNDNQSKVTGSDTQRSSMTQNHSPARSPAVEVITDENQIALEMLDQGEQGMIKVGDRQIAIPSLRSTESEMSAFTRFLTTFQLGNIERRKQKQLRQIVATAEVDVLRDRTNAIVKSHKGLTKACLGEILLAAQEFGLETLRKGEIRNQAALQTAVLKVSLQYVDFLHQLPSDFPSEVYDTIQDQAQDIYQQALQNIRSARFTIES